MNNKALVISIGMALGAVMMVQGYVTSIEDEAKKKFGTQLLVLVAKQDIKEMDTITDKSLEYREIPKKFLEPGAFSADPSDKDEQARSKDIKRFAGTIAVVPIRKGEQISFTKIMEPSVRTGLSPQVAPGRRAVSVGVTDLTGVSKLVKPGDRIDLIGVFDMGAGRENKYAKTVLQDVVILAVGKSVTNNPSRTLDIDPFTGKEKVRSLTEDATFNTVTLEVEPKDVPGLALMQSGSEVQLFMALRHTDDTDRTPPPTVGLRDLIPEVSRGARQPAGR
jgi:pilus assembly protein CpaB